MKNAIILLCNLIPAWWVSQCPPATHQQLIETYQTVATSLYEDYWPEWKDVPRHLLLVDDEEEHLFGSTYSDTTFSQNCEGMLSRPATMNKYMLATFPYINSEPTIIIGTPDNTQKTPLAWTLTLLHEHFHQLQFSHPEYYTAQVALDLDKGDQTGMWMLNHPFPYEDSVVVQKVTEMALNLSRLEDGQEEQNILIQHRLLKQQLKAIIGEEHYRYLNLQLWQEGFARFLELSMLAQWITRYDKIDQAQFEREELVSHLQHYQSKVMNHLTQASLHEQKRVYFYALGAAEAMLIERVNPEWKERYFDVLFSTDHLLAMEE